VLTWRSIAGFVQDDWRLTPKLMVNLGLRYSYVSPMKEANNLLGNFDPALGMVQQGQSSVGDTVIKPDHKNFSPRVGFAWDVTGKGTTVVRAGASVIYSTFVAASFLQQAGQQNFRGGSIGAVPTAATCTAGNTGCTGGTLGGNIALGTVFYNNLTPAAWNSPAGGPGVFPASAVSCTAASACAILAVDPNLRTPYITNWNLSVTRAFNSNLSLEVGYVGNHGSRLTGFRDINQTDANFNHPLTAFPYLNFINQMSNDSHSNYHSLQTTMTKRISHGFSFTAGYTYGHGLDNNSLNRTAYLPQDSSNPGAEYGSGDFDVRHRFTFTTTYNIPGIKGFGQLLEGWKLNSIVTIQSPQPWLITDTSNDFRGGDNSDRWDIFGNPATFRSGPNSIPFCSGFGVDNTGAYTTSGVTCTQTSGISGSTSAPLANSAAMATLCAAHAAGTTTGLSPTSNLVADGCFASSNSVLTPPAQGSFGNMGRNIFRDSGFKNVDFSVFKTFSWKERYSAQFRLEFFNLFNHPISANPYGSANGYGVGNDPSAGTGFGCGCATADVAAGSPMIGSGGPRAMQIGLKLAF